MALRNIFALASLAGLAACVGGAWQEVRAEPISLATSRPLERFGEIVGNAPIVVYGEDSHGMQAIHEFVPETFKYLVEKKGFRVFVFEVQWGVTEGLADYMASDRTELGPEESYWLNGAFASKPIAAMLVWIRTWNRAHPSDQIQIAGYQPEQPVTDFKAVFAYLDAHLPAKYESLKAGVAVCRAGNTAVYKTELDFIIASGKYHRAGKPAFTVEEREQCVKGLGDIDAALKSVVDKSKTGRLARLHGFSLISYFSNQRKFVDNYKTNADAPIETQRAWSAEAYGRGDAARHVVYKELKSLRFPKAKVFHWMHNWHSFRHASESDGIDGPGGAGIPRGTRSFGEWLAADEQSKVKVFVTVVPCGTNCKDPEPTNSAEPAFAELFGEKLSIIASDDPNFRDRLSLDQPRSYWANHHRFGFKDVIVSRQSNGIIYIPRSEIAK